MNVCVHACAMATPPLPPHVRLTTTANPSPSAPNPHTPTHSTPAGGSAQASEALHREIELLRAAGKPVVVSMVRYAAALLPIYCSIALAVCSWHCLRNEPCAALAG